MRATVLGMAVVATVMLGMVQPASAVNCKQVLKYLSTGRTPEQISETMVIDVGEIKKCQEEAAKAAPTPAAEKKE